MEENYVPELNILKKYSDVLVNYGLNGGCGVNKGDVVLLQVPECAKAMLAPLYETVIEAGCHPIVSFIPDGISKVLYEKGSQSQIEFFPEKFMKGRIDEVDHQISIIADVDPKELSGIPAEKLMAKQRAFKTYMSWREKKENAGQFSWTLCLFGTPKMAEEANLTLKEYWDEIIKACYLNEESPAKKWKEVQKKQDEIINWLENLKIEKVHVEAVDTDLWVRIGERRKWLGGRGCNIPSFEIFTSPDFRGTEGVISFTEPLYRYGDLIEGIRLEFKEGKVVKAQAKKNEKLLKEMIAQKGANQIGEFSLTDKRFSKITKFMAETLFDENVGGIYGNTHIAVGNSYKDAYDGDLNKTESEWENLGFNNSVIHTDIVSTSNRKVTAYTFDGEEVVIYENGEFKY